MARSLLIAALLTPFLSLPAGAQSPYAGQDARQIKALSDQDVSDLRAGRGMGLAKAAELNGYPGPMHVIELAGALGLTDAQRANTEALFRKMQTQAVAAGERLIEEERALDALFAARAVTPAALQVAMDRVARAQGEVRRVHLEAHVEQVAVLTPSQVTKYLQLRGYGATAFEAAHPHQPAHHH